MSRPPTTNPIAAAQFRDYYEDIGGDDDGWESEGDIRDQEMDEEKKKEAEHLDHGAQSTYIPVPIERTNESADWANKVSGHGINEALTLLRGRQGGFDSDEDDNSYDYDAE